MIRERIFSEMIRIWARKSELQAESRSYRPKFRVTAGQTTRIRTESPRKGPRMGLRCFYRKAPIKLMRCAKGIFSEGIWGCKRLSLLQWEKGSETPFCGGERVWDSLVPWVGAWGTRESQTLFPIARGSLRPSFPLQKGKPRTSPNPLSENPLSATHQKPSWIHVT